MNYMYMNINSNIENIKVNLKQNRYVTIIFLLISIVYLILARLLFIKNPYNIITKYGALSIVTSLFGGFFILMTFFFMRKKNELYSQNESNAPTIISYIIKLFLSILSFTVVGLIIFGIIYFFKNFPTLSNVLLYFLNIMIVLGIITIIYSFIKPLISKPKNPSIKLIMDIIVYIPCLILNFINYVLLQYKITTKPVWILFGIEIILIVFYFLLPLIFDKIIKHDGLLLLSKPKSLRHEEIIGSFEILNKKLDKNNYNYAISAWIYLDAMPPSTNSSYSENSTLLSYGGKPNIYYNGINNELIVSAKIGDDDKIIFKTKNIKYQKWFNIIINYQGGTMDIFIDNKLISSIKSIVPYMTHDNISVGKNNGIYGFISDVTYFNKAITKDKMSWIYKTTKI